MENRLASVVENKGWFRLSRFGGALRYQWLRRRRLAVFLLAVMAAVQIVDLGLAFLGVLETTVTPVQSDFSVALLLIFCCSFPVAKSETTFLLRFGTPRTSVWLSNLLSLFLTGAVYLVLSALLNAVFAVPGVLLAQAGKNVTMAVPAPLGEYLLGGLLSTLKELPMQLLWILEYAAIFYFVACCLRRWKIPTILVLVGVPALLFTLLLLPAINEASAMLESGGQNELVALMLKFISWLQKAAKFVGENWQTIQGVAGGVTLVLGYLVMRGTRQPE
ncbi:MAG: hypothetical protein IKK08_06995 [Clostridia bacterium]|nr:hypothetical protein [Clostridia bacterium]